MTILLPQLVASQLPMRLCSMSRLPPMVTVTPPAMAQLMGCKTLNSSSSRRTSGRTLTAEAQPQDKMLLPRCSKSSKHN